MASSYPMQSLAVCCARTDLNLKLMTNTDGEILTLDEVPSRGGVSRI